MLIPSFATALSSTITARQELIADYQALMAAGQSTAAQALRAKGVASRLIDPMERF